MNYFGVIVFFALLFISVYILYSIRKRENLVRTLKMSFLMVTMPKKTSDLDEKQDTQRDFKETVALMEQLLSSLKSIHSSKITKKILGQDHLCLEYIAHQGEILFYIVCPSDYTELLEKQINGFYPDAIIEQTPEVNIFKNRHFYT